MAFTHRIDMRNISRQAFLDKLRELDRQARGYFGVAEVDRSVRTEGTDAIVSLEPARGAPDMALLAGELAQSVKTINGAKGMANVTGAKALGELFRNHLADVKAQLAKAGADMDGAMVELKDTAAQATDMVKAVKTETADLRASLGLHSNNPPGDA